MSINIGPREVEELKPKIAVIGVGGAGGNAIANMIAAQVEGVDFIVSNTDAQSLNSSTAERRIQLGPDGKVRGRAVQRRPGRVAVGDHVVGDTESVHVFRQQVEHRLGGTATVPECHEFRVATRRIGLTHAGEQLSRVGWCYRTDN